MFWSTQWRSTTGTNKNELQREQNSQPGKTDATAARIATVEATKRDYTERQVQ